MQISTINAEQFRGTTFFTLTPHRWGNWAMIRDSGKHLEYMTQKAAEIAAKKNQGEKIAAAPLAVASDSGVDQSKGAVTGKKRLLVSAKLDALNTYLSDTKAKLCGVFGVAQQSRVLRGLYVLRNELIEEVNQQAEEARERLTEPTLDPETGETRPGLVPDFLASYRADIERTRTLPLLDGGLGPLFDESDYPSEAQLAERFGLDVSWLALGIPEDLPPALKEKAAAKFESQLQEAAEECKGALRASLGTFLDRLVERLQPTAEGKPKVFRDSLIENVAAFVDVFDKRNFVQDGELAALVDKCKAVLSDPKLTPENVRKYADVRENTRQKFEEISGALNKMIETRKARAFDFADE